jgi:hypothetical protein
LQAVRGCKTPLNKPANIDKFQTLECPRKALTGETMIQLEAFSFWSSKGLMPNSGSWMEQPAKLFEIFGTASFYYDKFQPKDDK